MGMLLRTSVFKVVSPTLVTSHSVGEKKGSGCQGTDHAGAETIAVQWSVLLRQVPIQNII